MYIFDNDISFLNNENSTKLRVMKEIIDISIPINSLAVKYPDDPDFELTQIRNVKYHQYNLHTLKTSLHLGTHIDTPYHFFNDGRCLNEYSIERFILNAIVLDMTGRKKIQHKDLLEIDMSHIDAILFKTDNSINELFKKTYTDEYCFFTEDAAIFLSELSISLVGIDYVSPDNPLSEDFFVHKTLLRKDILILENISLTNVNEGYYELICLPLKISGAEASLVRAVLRK